jgi:hypothetical protein
MTAPASSNLCEWNSHHEEPAHVVALLRLPTGDLTLRICKACEAYASEKGILVSSARIAMKK